MADLDGIAVDELAELAGVDRSTASRWKSKKSRTPAAVLRLALFRVWGDLEQIFGATWSRWRIGRDGLLYAPGWRQGFAPWEIHTMPFLYGRIRTLELEVKNVMRRRRLDFHHAGRRCRHRRAANE